MERAGVSSAFFAHWLAFPVIENSEIRLLEGNSLSELLQLKKQLDIARFLNIFNQVGEALIEAHNHELFHGILSPDKIVLTQNEVETDMVKLIDFGMPPDPVRNAFFLSPEQCIDKSRSDEKSDDQIHSSATRNRRSIRI